MAAFAKSWRRESFLDREVGPLSGANRKTFTRSELTASEPEADD